LWRVVPIVEATRSRLWVSQRILLPLQFDTPRGEGYPHVARLQLESQPGIKELPMSTSTEKEYWLDRWFPLLVILFGIIFVSILVSFKPMA
jgi:hypothetical protein